ncbi:hypothetical protein P154DRAFT_518647 [Amniculicola lignicola CBS 123094]|uniref:Uncharacterized protein n=1 Tax=Amniculicola lignicola CBS 123094 TaxID=1392246 RepID=A0A6A5WTE0_9PLEO|nr:hypothetical protein P154DRAFT_518647 [Amniculicola lignicola CBS 123094]
MKCFTIAVAAFAAAVSAYSYDAEVCTVITVTETVYASKSVTPYYPIPSGTGYPVIPSGTGYPIPSGTGYPIVPSSSPAPYYPIPSGTGSPVYPSGTAAPSGTGVYTPSPPEFTGAASAMKVPAAIAGVAGLVAFFL